VKKTRQNKRLRNAPVIEPERYLRIVELLQFFSDAQTLRVRRKQSTGVDDPSDSKR
jgi:hypothetical protein